jgi:hypothetical protein
MYIYNMRLPIATQIHEHAKECPFYCKDTTGSYGCVIKELTSQGIWVKAVQQKEDPYFSDEFKEDCGGEFEKCCFANLIWTPAVNSENKEENNYEDQEDSDDEDGESEDGSVEIKISVHKVDNPYSVKTDVLIYPTNNLLEIDDLLLNRMSRNVVQEECDAYRADVKMGSVYITSSGGNHPKGIKASKIYHAVVAGESRLVNESDIKESIMKALMLADENEAEIVTMLPADCGTHDIDQTAFVQINAISEFIQNAGVDNIKYIFIVMDDHESYDAYVEQFSRVFSD